MDDETTFGPVFHRLTFGQAISKGLLSDYQVAVVGVDDATYADWVARGRLVTLDGTTVTDARSLAGQIGLAKAIHSYGPRRTITFHSRISAARQFAQRLSIVQRKVVTPNDFTDLGVVEKRLANFEDRYNQAARPFKWKFTSNDLNDLLARLEHHDPAEPRAA